MFIGLLVVTFLIALLVSFIIVRTFGRPIQAIVSRIISDDISSAWTTYIKFAAYVVGISNGVRVWELERYITPLFRDDGIIELTTDRWVLEVYRTIIGSLQGIAWMLLVFFLIALVAFVVVRAIELRRENGRRD